MARLGRVHGNLMIDLQPTKQKTAASEQIGLVSQLRGAVAIARESRLERADWNLA